ncbi:MAG: SAM-dependent chlorinase/fluorinase [Thermoplasmata archaeon]|nr:SAM-dependent chlorinase/fluorinase [Thermoplasmata archaeon]
MRSSSRLVTLSTDLGSAYAAQMKGVLYRALPPERVVDLTHDLPRHGIEESAFLVRQMLTAFPPGVVHVVVVDPGVGGARAPIAIRTKDGSYLVGPDNGVLSLAAERLGIAQAVRLDPRRVGAAPRVGRTFDGRDLFAPAAARLALGNRLSTLGPKWKPFSWTPPTALVGPARAEGVILHIDRFGNAITNLPATAIPGRARTLSVKVGGRPARRASNVSVYDELRPRQLGILASSFGTLEVAVREGSAASRLGLTVGEKVTLRWTGASPRAVGGK